ASGRRPPSASSGCLVIESRRGRIAATTRADMGMQEGVVMMPFSFNEAAANLITNEALDPYGKIPEFKFCAVNLKKGERATDILSQQPKKLDRRANRVRSRH
ncbi:MAG: molybdopterin dinucleotide binding domain-containing protein, partial [Gammaproteobacteria bacterium]